MFEFKASYLPIFFVVLACSNSGAWGQTNGGRIRGSDVYMATSYSGADPSAKINACIAAVISAGGGVCDASGFTGTQKMSQEIRLGGPASVAGHIGVTLLLPETAAWVWNLTDGSSCGIYQYSSTSLLGHQPGGGGNRMVLAANSGSQMDSIYCTDASSSGANYVRAEGFAVWNNQPGSIFANGVVHIRDAVDQSRFVGIFAENYYGDVWHIESACCGAHFDDIQGTSNGTPSLVGLGQGGVPLTLGPGKVDAISINDSGFNAPGVGYPDIVTTGKTGVSGVTFNNVYMEGNGMVDSTTSMVYIGPYAGPINFFGGIANTEQATLQSTKTVFESHGLQLAVNGFSTANTILGINDVLYKIKVNVWNFSGSLGTIPSYQTPHAQPTSMYINR